MEVVPFERLRATLVRAGFARALLAFLVLGALSAAVLWPARGADFSGDDWHFLALLRHVDSPLAAFDSNFALSYLYRPLSFLMFWLSLQAFGLDAASHYSLNIALHAAVALALVSVARAAGLARMSAGLLGAAFVLLPATSATPLWISNRFDLLATLFMLLAMVGILRWSQDAGRTRWAVGSVLALLAALLSKELAFALPFPLLLIVWFAPGRSGGSQRLVFAFAIVLASLLALALRANALGGLAGDPLVKTGAMALWNGSLRWAGNFLTALSTGGATAVVLVFVAAALALLANGLGRSSRTQDAADNASSTPHGLAALPNRRWRRVVFASLLVLLAVLVVLQAPIAAVALPEHDSIVMVSLRFFYAPIAVLLVLIAMLLAGSQPVAPVAFGRSFARSISVLGALICVVGLAMLAMASHRQAQQWADGTQAESARSVALQAQVLTRMSAALAVRPCVVDVVPLASTAIATDLDLRIKSALPRGDSRVDCLLISEPPQLMSLTRHAPCDGSQVLPWTSRVPGLQPVARSGTCTYFAFGRRVPALSTPP